MQHRMTRSCSLFLATVFASGCGTGDGSRVEISGTVAYRGKAVPGGTVLLQPQAGKAIVGVIDEQGKYRVSAPGGTYRVAVVASAAIPDGVDPWKSNVKLPPPLVPEKYGRPETSATSITVKPDQPTIDIALE